MKKSGKSSVVLNNIEVMVSKCVYDVSSESRYMAFVPALQVYGIGSTEEQAMADVDKGIDFFIEFHSSTGMLHAKLMSLGWMFFDHTITPPAEFRIPRDMVNESKIIKRDLPSKFALATA